MASAREASAITKKQLAMRESLWPGVDSHLWHRTANKGFTTIPKTMPMILKIMDEMTKGAPVSSTYLSLWCNTWDNSYVALNKVADLAYASGFGGQRGEHTWITRVKKLNDLRFINIKPGKSGPMSNVIIWNPHLVLRWHHQEKTPGLMEGSYNALLEWALDIGAKDMTEPMDPVPEPGTIALPTAPLPKADKKPTP
jgi:hypothetical protein